MMSLLVSYAFLDQIMSFLDFLEINYDENHNVILSMDKQAAAEKFIEDFFEGGYKESIKLKKEDNYWILFYEQKKSITRVNEEKRVYCGGDILGMIIFNENDDELAFVSKHEYDSYAYEGEKTYRISCKR